MKNFDADKEIKREKSVYYNDERLYLQKFEYHRKILSFCLDFHVGSIFFVFIQKFFNNHEAFSKNKFTCVSYFLIFFLGLTYLEDFKYCLFRKDENDGFIKQFKIYEKKLCQMIKSKYFKFENLKTESRIGYSTGESSNIHVLIQDLKKIDDEYNELLKKISNTSPDYLNKVNEIQNFKTLKKQIQRKILEINKNKLI
jgi:hypothetical protein